MVQMLSVISIAVAGWLLVTGDIPIGRAPLTIRTVTLGSAVIRLAGLCILLFFVGRSAGAGTIWLGLAGLGLLLAGMVLSLTGKAS